MADIPQITQIVPAESKQEKPSAHNDRSEGPRFAWLESLAGAVNIPFLLIVFVLVGYGLVVCASAIFATDEGSLTRQVTGIVGGLVCMAFVWHFDYRRLAGLSTLLLVVSLALILMPLLPFIGMEVNGARSWVKIGMQFQPGEFAKVTVILFAASLVARYEGMLDDLREYLKVVGFLLLPFVCIMLQPDLGTGLVYLFIGGTALVMGGARPKYLLITLVVSIAVIALVFWVDELFKYEVSDGVYEYHLIKDYQRNRLTVFLNPEQDLTGEGYNLAQAMIAIGAGGMFGVGLFNGTQATYGYLPEAQTDFIFCVLCQELGFVGALFLLLLYAALIFMSLRIARACHNLFGMLCVCCIVGMWLFQILENIGMTCGLMPITGIPLPFVSFGSSFMVVNFILLGLIGSVWSHNGIVSRRRG